MGLDQPRHDRVSPTKEFPRFGVGNGRRTDLRLGFCHFRHSGSFLEQALGEHDLVNALYGDRRVASDGREPLRERDEERP